MTTIRSLCFRAIPLWMAFVFIFSGCGGKGGDSRTPVNSHFPDVDGSEFEDLESATNDRKNQSAEMKPAEEDIPGGMRAPVIYDEETGTLKEYAGAENLPAGQSVDALNVIYFGFDSDVLSEGARKSIEENVSWLQENDSWNIVLRGHTDDRGTEEYNIALGSRRAQSVRSVMAELGIPPSRMTTVSYGKTMPLEQADSEASRAKNRRVDFLIYQPQ